MAKRNNQARRLLLEGSDPGDLAVQHVDLSGLDEKVLRRVPPLVACHSLDLSGSGLSRLPDGWSASYQLNLSGCAALRELRAGLRLTSLNLSGCAALTSLPEDLETNFLELSECRGLRRWPASARVTMGTVAARNCVSLESVPPGMGPLASLDIQGCARLGQLPEGLVVRSFVDLAGTKLTGLPESLARTALRWRGVAISAQIAFFPETITSAQILAEPNMETRRVMIERVGFPRFLAEAGAKILHEDRDAGGQRQLLRVALPNDEDLVCVSVRCPSTGRHYLIRVPPRTQTCHEAVAWTAGFDSPEEYLPLQET